VKTESFGSQFLEAMSKAEALLTYGGGEHQQPGQCPASGPSGSTCVQSCYNGSCTHTND